MASPVYKVFEHAMRTRKQIVCVYGGYGRELCAVILGHSDGREKALTYQFAGDSKSGLPPGGEWRCLFLSEITKARLRDGPWLVRIAPHPAARLCEGCRYRCESSKSLPSKATHKTCARHR